MDTQDLERPLMNSGVRSVNFFNGRLLTAGDLRREQEARRSVDGWLGQALGEGVASGLEVKKHADSTAPEPLVTVAAGLALNRQGQALCLNAPTTLALVRKAKLAVVDDASFGQCGKLQTGTYVAGPGIYLLTIAPANTKAGKALTNGLDQYGGKCNTDTIVETVQFRLIALESEFADLDFTNENKLRNQVAYRCFGADDLVSCRADPFGADCGSYGVLDSLTKDVLTPCDVPLAIVYWTLTGGIRFVDMWSVRRPMTGRVSSDWPWLAGERRSSEGRAMFLQFQEQIAQMTLAQGDVRNVTALGSFAFLPAVGMLPMPGKANEDDKAISSFFQGLTIRGPAFIEGARLESLIRNSFAYPPIDLESGELIWLYWVRENRQAIDNRTEPPRACMVFASGHIPYIGDARFDTAYFDFSNYALR